MSDSVVGLGNTVGASVIRPADTTAYAAGNVISDSKSVATGYLTFPSAGKGGQGFGIIQEAILTDSANVATKPDLELWLFDQPPTVNQDGAAFAPSNADLLRLVTIISFSSATYNIGAAGAGAAGNSANIQKNLGIPFNAQGTLNLGQSLYGVLVVRNAYVPVSAEQFSVRLQIIS